MKTQQDIMLKIYDILRKYGARPATTLVRDMRDGTNPDIYGALAAMAMDETNALTSGARERAVRDTPVAAPNNEDTEKSAKSTMHIGSQQSALTKDVVTMKISGESSAQTTIGPTVDASVVPPEKKEEASAADRDQSSVSDIKSSDATSESHSTTKNGGQRYPTEPKHMTKAPQQGMILRGATNAAPSLTPPTTDDSIGQRAASRKLEASNSNASRNPNDSKS